jgi:hypothetical protein
MNRGLDVHFLKIGVPFALNYSYVMDRVLSEEAITRLLEEIGDEDEKNIDEEFDILSES